MPTPETTRPAQGHTPGPWNRITHAHIASAAGIVATHAGHRSDSLRYSCEPDSMEAAANGYLLASAPELLAALEATQGALRIATSDLVAASVPIRPEINAADDLASATLRKATNPEPRGT